MKHAGIIKSYAASMVMLGSAVVALPVLADHHGMDGKEKMTIVESASKADNLSTLVAAIKAGGLADTLSGTGPFTVFAPTNAAFEKLPAGTVDMLLKPENKDQLQSILTYHVIPAKATSSAAVQMVQDDGGTHTVKTVQGGELTLSLEGDSLMIADANGNMATVVAADMMQSNGVVHVIDTVLMP